MTFAKNLLRLLHGSEADPGENDPPLPSGAGRGLPVRGPAGNNAITRRAPTSSWCSPSPSPSPRGGVHKQPTSRHQSWRYVRRFPRYRNHGDLRHAGGAVDVGAAPSFSGSPPLQPRTSSRQASHRHHRCLPRPLRQALPAHRPCGGATCQTRPMPEEPDKSDRASSHSEERERERSVRIVRSVGLAEERHL